MKSLIIKFFIVVFFLLCFNTIVSSKAHAAAPDVSGSVLVKGTNAPVVGIWVKWTDDTGHIRYAKTNASGIYTFVSWGKARTDAELVAEQKMRDKQHATWIDTNFDGVKDARMASTTYYKHFGCVQNPHQFTAVVPKDKKYKFQGVSFSFNNGYITVHPKTIIEIPPTPTPTPTLTPTSSPSPTPIPPACGVICTTPADCEAAKDGCTTCIDDVCKLPPTPTPIPPACGVICTTPADCEAAKDGCTTCIGGVCKLPPTPTPIPTPTPPPFNPASCVCDGIANTDLFSGQNATITSYAKVVGLDVSKAQVVDQKFFLAEGAETIATIIARSNSIPATVIDTSSSQVRYQSQWQLQIPQLKSGATYRIWSQINCQPKTVVYNYPSLSHKVVLGQQTQSASRLDIIINALRNFLSSSTNRLLTGKKSLQLETITPVNVYQRTCSFIKFKVGE